MKTMKTCKTGCGKMSKGGKITGIKKISKMQEGGSEKGVYRQYGSEQQQKPVMGKKGGYMKAGGEMLPMMGMPMYSNNPRSEQGRILKAGGSNTNRAVKSGCTGGMVKDASGKCVMERKFKSGGTLKPVPAGKTGLAKLPTAVRNKMGFQKKGGPVKKK
jgi:hypothetical protein